MNKEMQDLFYELKQVLVQHSPKWDTLCDIEQYIIDLEKQLEEKDKVIDDITNFFQDLRLYDNESVEFEIGTNGLEILERSKNESS